MSLASSPTCIVEGISTSFFIVSVGASNLCISLSSKNFSSLLLYALTAEDNCALISIFSRILFEVLDLAFFFASAFSLTASLS